MNKKRGLVISVILSAVIVSAAGTLGTKYYKAKAKTDEINSFIDDVNKSRTSVRKNITKIKPEYADWLKDDKSPFTDKEVENMINYKNKFNDQYNNGVLKSNTDNYDENKEITSKQAKEDVLSHIKDVSKITDADFRKIIVSDLSFIMDKHFSIMGGNNDFDLRGEYYYVGDDFIGKDSSGYYKEKSGEKYYIKEVNNDKNIEKHIHKTIDNEGRLSYKIAEMDKFTYNGEISRTLTLKADKDKETFENVILKNQALYNYVPDYNKSFDYSVHDNIPVAKINRFFNDSQRDTTLSDFADTAVKMKKYPAAILDLRGNSGGFTDVVEQWILSYFGVLNYKDNLILRGSSMTLQSPVIKAINQTSYTELFKEQAGRESKTINNKNTLFVLVDRGSASASECFLEALSNMDNVVVVGTNTSGCLLNGNASYYKLNNSSICVYMGNRLYLSPFGDDFEGKGFEPDLLVNSKDALDSTLAMIKYYKLNEK